MAHSSVPTFSVVIFTKNRPQLAAFAVESVLCQSFGDFEIIICDNDDGDSTRRVISAYRDRRVRYHRTGGLSMVDNWQRGLLLAKGRFVMSLTDRSVLKRDTLARIRRAIREHRRDVYVWMYDELLEQRGEDRVLPYTGKHGDEAVSSRSLFDLFLKNGYEAYGARLPRGLNSCCSSDLLREIRASTGGRVCFPMAPDFTQAFLTLAHTPSVVFINEPLFVWGGQGLSNGGGTYDGTETFRRFLSDLNKTEADLYDRVPIKTVGIHNMVCNDLMHLKALFPGRFAEIDLDLPAYFTVCHDEIVEWLSADDPLYAPKMAAWQHAVTRQTKSVQEQVRHTIGRSGPTGQRVAKAVLVRNIQKEYQQGVVALPWLSWPGLRARLRRQLGWIRRRLYLACFPIRQPLRGYKFRTPIEAVRWIEACDRREKAVQAIKRTALYGIARTVYRTIVPRRASIAELNHRYDRQTAEVIKRTLNHDSTGIDIGAHAGAILREMFAAAPRGRHFAFEPLPHLAASIRRDYPDARVHAVALSDTEGTGTFHYVVNSPMESGLKRHAIHGDVSVVQEITVAIKRLDEVIGRNEHIAFIKIDAEGAELPIIRGGLQTIRRCRPLIVFETGNRSTPFYEVGPDDIFTTIVDDLGMRLSTMSRWLEGGSAYTRRQFRKDYHQTNEFYFLAY